jgi:hypothetical protein
MKLVARIATIAAVFIASLVVSATVIVYLNQHRIVTAVLTSIRNRTGVEIVAPSSQIEVRNHVVVVLEHPTVRFADREIVSMERVRAVVNFRSIFTHGLPLRELDLEHAIVTAPFEAASAGNAALPHPDRALIDETLARLGDLARISRRLVITDMELRDQSGTPLLRHAHLLAYHRRATPHLWSIGFQTDCEFPRLRGTHATGDFKLGAGGSLRATQVMQGTLWFWQLPLQHLMIGNVEANGQSQGHVKLSVAQDASLEGVAALGLKALVIRSPDLSAPMDLGDYALEARFSTSPRQVTISNARLTHAGKPLVAGRASIEKPFEANPQVAVGIAELKLVWKEILASIRALKRVPQDLEVVGRRMKSGRLEVQKASIDSPLIALKNF